MASRASERKALGDALQALVILSEVGVRVANAHESAKLRCAAELKIPNAVRDLTPYPV